MEIFPKGSPAYTKYTLLFKLFLIVGMAGFVMVFVLYTQNIINGLKEDVVRISGVYARLWQLAASDPSSGPEINVIFEEVIQKSNFPIIITDPQNDPQFWKGVGIAADDTTMKSKDKLKTILAEMDKMYNPIPIYYGEDRKSIIHYLHYGDSPIVQQLRWMPFVEGAVVAAFVWIAIFVFRNIKRSEQRSIWVGMAKETAHQLGTPLSSLLGWLELIRMKIKEGDSPAAGLEEMNISDITDKMLSDVHRLEKIANRFGQIGSIPELKNADINKIVNEVIDYFTTRIPNQGKGVDLIGRYGEVKEVRVNDELISWVIENLVKNSLEAIKPDFGRIMVETKPCEDKNCVKLIVSDNGRGIPPRMQKRIFYPGVTSKKRGWGLGLTLAKRIIEEYHGGKIRLVESVPARRTAFEITLPAT
ncbi:MAG: two-component sensor histidine kinase [candidate division Zixibacteria bacterium]|nr:two-component sensor histidine kinase [candidate division Zixibacteria bacterium]